jgi:hypothetical protein
VDIMNAIPVPVPGRAPVSIGSADERRRAGVEMVREDVEPPGNGEEHQPVFDDRTVVVPARPQEPFDRRESSRSTAFYSHPRQRLLDEFSGGGRIAVQRRIPVLRFQRLAPVTIRHGVRILHSGPPKTGDLFR